MKNIALIGFMGSGKSVCGKLLAKRLKYHFVDTDKEIERLAGCPVSRIWEKDGESRFRQLEAEVMAKVTRRDRKVIACGGGAVLDPANVRRLKENCIIVYLKAAQDRLYERLKYSTHRPLLNVPDARREIERLLVAREKTYQEVADLLVDTSHLSVDEVVGQIMDGLAQRRNSR